MTFVIALCLVAMVAIVATAVVKICTLNRADKLKYLKNFKYGQFALIYVAAIPLFWIGYYYGMQSLGGSFVKAVGAAIKLVVLEMDYDAISALMTDNVFYRVTMFCCYGLVVVNTAIFAITLFARRALNWHYRNVAKKAKKVYVVVGFNEQNQQIIQSIDKQQASVVLLVDDVTDKIADYVYVNKITCSKISLDNLATTVEKLFVRFDDRRVNVIINTDNDQQNVIYVEQLANLLYSKKLTSLCEDYHGLHGYVFGDSQNMSAFLHVVEDTNGCIHYVNKYKLVAMDFVGKYPLTQFMTEEHIDTQTATVKDDVSVNVVMLGFGQTNQQLFLTSVANDQFCTLKNGKIEQKQVDYWIYDRHNSRNDKNLNHNYYRYSNELDQIGNYLPLPPKPANEQYYEVDINETVFYDDIRDNLSPHKRKNDDGTFTQMRTFNYVVVALGPDMQNLDFAEKITTKLKEWDLFHCTKVFVKISDADLTGVIHREYAKSGFITFGNEQNVVYDVNQIVGEKQEAMALDRHLSYALTENMTADQERVAKQKALSKWYAQAQIQRESNVYGCLSIRTKLHLLGYDYCPKTDARPCANDQYMQHYQQGDPIVYDGTKTVKGKRNVLYTNDYVVGSLRQTLAWQEHQRWNAYMITEGMIPSTIEQIKAGDSKNLPLRRHGNISTFDGLVTFRQLEATRRGVSEEETDVIRYDYQIMDDLVWLLDNNGYKIVKR